MAMKETVSQDMTQYNLVQGKSSTLRVKGMWLKDNDSMFIQNISKFLPGYTVSHPTEQYVSPK